MSAPLSRSLDRFEGCRVLVVGDAILDHYVIGDVRRTSPEAPVMVLHAREDEWLPGGAANVARNLSAQGARVVFASATGNDETARQMVGLLAADGRIEALFHSDPSRITPLKTRCVAQGQQMLRIDREKSEPLSAGTEKKLLALVRKTMRSVDGVVLSDYGKGVLTPTLIAEVIAMAAEKNLEVVVDPKGSDYSRYRGATVITPNRKEASEASDVAIKDNITAVEAAKNLQRQVRGSAICITMGAGGVWMCPKGARPVHFPSQAREVFDVTGAGDTFVSVLALARFTGARFSEAADLANKAAGITVGRFGVAVVTREELRREIEGTDTHRKQLAGNELHDIRQTLRRAGRRVVFTNGCFDLLNVRHLRLLAKARALGDVLVVAINSDESVRRLKGEPRPLLTVSDRVELLGALPYVDYIAVFDEDTPVDLLKKLRPDILVKGDNVSEAVGKEIVEAYGGEVRMLDLGIGPTTDEIFNRAIESATAPPPRRKKK